MANNGAVCYNTAMEGRKAIKRWLRRLQTRRLVRAARDLGRRQPPRPAGRPLRLVLLLSRPQDLDLYLDIYRQSLATPAVEAVFWATTRAVDHFPATGKLLAAHGLKVDFTVDHHNLAAATRRLLAVDALLNTVESSFASHKVPHRLVQIANALGVCTYTLQHGFENVGLTYLDAELGPDVTFAARRVLTWGPVASLPGKLSRDTRQKCLGVGCPKIHLQEREGPQIAAAGKPIISVFEGLHAPRFDAAYRRLFFADLQLMAVEFPEFRFLLKPHPGIVVREKEHAASLQELHQVEVLDPADPDSCRQWPTPELLAASRAVVTTPSTIALDAAMTGTPVAVTRYRQKIPYYDLYRPLPLLDQAEDWRRFLRQIERQHPAPRQQTDAFLHRVLMPGDAAARILDVVLADGRERRRQGHTLPPGGEKHP